MRREEARAKAEQLVARMTLEEKASQLRYDSPPVRRLDIPAYNWWNEALHGVARAGVATSFPQAIGMAASFDEEMIKNIGDVIATEGRAKYNAYSAHEDRDIYKGLTFWSPNVNIFRDPRWGRGQETYGEDPYLSGRLGAAFVKGLQGDKETMKAAGCVKHFAVHSGPEDLRHEFNAIVTKKDMYETYLPAFETVVKEADVEGVTGAYNCVNGEPCCGSKTLIQDILRDEWKFVGHYVSDCWAIRDFHEHHGITPDAKASAALALNTGCDLNCGNTYLHILNAYKHGLVTEEAITEAAARESMVLLKNDGILPLNKEQIKTIGVIGPNANSRAALIGNYHGTSSEHITVLEGIRRYVGSEVRVLYSEGVKISNSKTEDLAMEYDRISEAKIVAEHSDVVILCVGLNELLEGEEGDESNQYASGDKIDILLPASQRTLMEAVSQTGTPVVLCLMAGSDIDLSYAIENFSAIMQLWYPGARGGKAAAELLFGEYSPSGKLCVTFYDDIEDLPEFTDYSMKNRTYRYLESKAQFPFGYGLTYGKAIIQEAKVLSYDMGKDIRVQIENKSDREIEEVLQVYIKDINSCFATVNPKLCAFKRVILQSYEKKTVEISLDERALMVVNDEGKNVIDCKHYEIHVGFSQPDEKSVELTGMKPVVLDLELS